MHPHHGLLVADDRHPSLPRDSPSPPRLPIFSQEHPTQNPARPDPGYTRPTEEQSSNLSEAPSTRPANQSWHPARTLLEAFWPALGRERVAPEVINLSARGSALVYIIYLIRRAVGPKKSNPKIHPTSKNMPAIIFQISKNLARGYLNFLQMFNQTNPPQTTSRDPTDSERLLQDWRDVRTPGTVLIDSKIIWGLPLIDGSTES